MDIINRDYKDWYLKCRFEWMLNATANALSEHFLIYSYDNVYLNEFLETQVNLNYSLTNLFDLNQMKRNTIFVIMNKISTSELDDLEYDSKKHKYKVWNVYQKFIKYETTKSPVNYIVDEFNTQDYEKYTRNKDRLAKEYIAKVIKKQYVLNNTKIFNKVEIETINRCNNKCSFCPVNIRNDSRRFALMDQSLFTSIIDQLAELKYSSCIALFSNNEPLLDKRLISFAQYTRKKLPDNFMYIYTNGLLLTSSYLKELLKYFDYIYINNYSHEKKLIPSIQDVWQFLQDEQIDKSRVAIHLRDITEKLSSRAGTAPNRESHFAVNSSCLLPFNQLSIRANGKVSLCSIDALCQRVMGDLTQNSIYEIWNSNEFETVRRALIDGRTQIFPCNNCDMLFTTIPFEKVR